MYEFLKSKVAFLISQKIYLKKLGQLKKLLIKSTLRKSKKIKGRKLRGAQNLNFQVSVPQ